MRLFIHLIILIMFFSLLYVGLGCNKPIPSDNTGGSGEDNPSWSKPVEITTGTGFNSYHISMDKNGTAIMVYSIWDEAKGIDRIFAKVYNPETGWGEDLPVDSGVEKGDAREPFAAWDISDSGSAFITFTQGNGIKDRVYARRYTKGAGWEDNVTLLSIDNGKKSGEPRIAFDSSGNAMAVFTQGGKLYASKYNGSSLDWDTPKEISAGTGPVYSPKICFLESGQFMVLFYQLKSSTLHLFAIRYNGTSWGLVPEQIDSDYHNFYEAVMRADGFGNLMAAFSEGAGNKLYVKRYYNGWKEAKEIGISSGKDVSIAYDINHNASVLFVQDINGLSHVYSSAYTNSSDTWSEPVVIDVTDGSNSDNPRIIFDSLNRATAVYSKLVDGIPHIFSHQFDWDSGWKTPMRIDGNSTSPASFPEIVMDWQGGALVLFAVPDMVSGQIYAVKHTIGVNY
ncbi:MAG: hypothetical protein HZA08_02385 [Nitrospirae bacterium]|nr:hypothetical protein [Nitrospirota bacterium]